MFENFFFKKAHLKPPPHPLLPQSHSLGVARKSSIACKSYCIKYTYRFSNFTGKMHISPHLYFNVLTLSSM